MKIKPLTLGITLAILLNGFSLQFSIASFAHESHREDEQSNSFDQHYFVDSYEVSTYQTMRTLILGDPCEPYEGSDPEELFDFEGRGCNPFGSSKVPVAVLPATVEGGVEEVYRGRYEHIAPSHPAQDFILTLGFMTLSNWSDRVISVERNSQTIAVVIASDEDTSWERDGRHRSVLAQIIQVKLGYLEPGEYRFEVRYNLSKDGIPERTHMEEPVFLNVLENSPD